MTIHTFVRFLPLAALALAAGTARAAVPTPFSYTITAAPVGGRGSCPHGNSFPDGCPGAQSSGNWQVPTFFTGYTARSYPNRPAWNVAGVDYPIGYAGTLTDASTATLPACASRTGSGSGPFSITINTEPCTLSHLDFSTRNGICVTDNASGSGTVTFDNDKFGWGTNCNANGGSLLYLRGTAPVVIQYAQLTGSQVGSPGLEALVQTSGASPASVTIHYSAFIATDQADIQLNAATTLNVSFNFAQGIGCCGNHGDWVIPNWTGPGAYNDSFNTVYTGPSSAATTLCYITAQNGVGTISGSCKNNTLVANGHGTPTVGFLVETDAVVVNAFSVSNNWMDMTNSYGYFTDQSGSTFNGPITCSGNKNLITGATATGTIAGHACN